MRTTILRLAVVGGIIGLAGCGGDDDVTDRRIDIEAPSAAEPTATSAAPAEMGVDTVGDGVHGDTMR